MSTRPTSAPLNAPGFNPRSRLHEVLAAGLVRSHRLTVPVGVTQRKRSQPGSIPTPPEVESLLDALPPEINQLVYSEMSCKEVARLCGMNRAFRNICRGPTSEVYWRWQCRRLGYDRFRGILLVGPPDQPPGGGLWREYYEWYCIRIKHATYIANALAMDTRTLDPALVDAVSNGFTPIALGLIAAGVDVNLAGILGRTALMNAALNDAPLVIQALLTAGATVDLTDEDGQTAFMFASRFGSIKAARMLLKAGADPNRVDDNGNTALVLAFYESGNSSTKEMVDFLITTTDVSGQGGWAIMAAVVESAGKVGAATFYEEVLKKLLAQGADPNAQDANGTPVLIVGINQFVENDAVTLGMIRGDLSPRDDERRYLNQSWPNPNAVLMLIDADDIELSAVDQLGKTALAIAVEKGYEYVVEALLVNGYVVDYVDQSGKTALMYAIESEHVFIEKMLRLWAEHPLQYPW